jgi:hypothetical protein
MTVCAKNTKLGTWNRGNSKKHEVKVQAAKLNLFVQSKAVLNRRNIQRRKNVIQVFQIEIHISATNKRRTEHRHGETATLQVTRTDSRLLYEYVLESRNALICCYGGVLKISKATKVSCSKSLFLCVPCTLCKGHFRLSVWMFYFDEFLREV